MPLSEKAKDKIQDWVHCNKIYPIEDLITEIVDLEKQPIVGGVGDEDAIVKALDSLVLREELWEDGERILTINGKPVGATFHRAEVERWWGEEMKREIARAVREKMAGEMEKAFEAARITILQDGREDVENVPRFAIWKWEKWADYLAQLKNEEK